MSTKWTEFLAKPEMRGVLGALNYLAMKENSTIGLSDSTNIEFSCS